jgi:hypothetical protein
VLFPKERLNIEFGEPEKIAVISILAALTKGAANSDA